MLVDLSLPDAQGLDVLIEAQQIAPTVPLVALSRTPDDSLATQALQLGARDFLVKSEINPVQLASRFRSRLLANEPSFTCGVSR